MTWNLQHQHSPSGPLRPKIYSVAFSSWGVVAPMPMYNKDDVMGGILGFNRQKGDISIISTSVCRVWLVLYLMLEVIEWNTHHITSHHITRPSSDKRMVLGTTLKTVPQTGTVCMYGWPSWPGNLLAMWDIPAIFDECCKHISCMKSNPYTKLIVMWMWMWSHLFPDYWLTSHSSQSQSCRVAQRKKCTALCKHFRAQPYTLQKDPTATAPHIIPDVNHCSHPKQNEKWGHSRPTLQWTIDQPKNV